MKTAVLLMLTVLASGPEPGAADMRFLDYRPTGVAYWYPDQVACSRGMLQLVQALDLGALGPLPSGPVETWCLEVPLDGLPFHGRGIAH